MMKYETLKSNTNELSHRFSKGTQEIRSLTTSSSLQEHNITPSENLHVSS